MTDILPFLKSLLTIPGLSGFEAPAADLIEKKWSPLVDEISRSRIGSLHGLKKGSAPGKTGRPSALIAAHMDGIGLMVTRVAEGFIYATAIGGIDSRILPGTPVSVHGRGEALYGVIAMPSANLLPEGQGTGALPMKYLMIDTGLSPAEVAKRVRVGDLVSFDTQPLELSGGTLSGHTLDNRASVAALTICLEELQNKKHVFDLWAVCTAQEEETLGGAATSAFQLRPTLAVILDVTFGKGTGVSNWEGYEIGKGPALAVGPNIQPHLFKRFKEVAEKAEIPYTVEPMPSHSSTDADALQLAADGVPTMVVSIPLRYMHTPVELVSLKDIQRAGRLLAEFVASLEAGFMDNIAWD